MDKFVVAFVSLFDNEILMQVIEAKSGIEAALEYCKQNYFSDGSFGQEEFSTLEELKSYMFNGDCLINVIEVK